MDQTPDSGPHRVFFALWPDAPAARALAGHCAADPAAVLAQDLHSRAAAIADLEQRIGHSFNDRALLERALTHASATGADGKVRDTGVRIVVPSKASPVKGDNVMMGYYKNEKKEICRRKIDIAAEKYRFAAEKYRFAAEK